MMRVLLSLLFVKAHEDAKEGMKEHMDEQRRQFKGSGHIPKDQFTRSTFKGFTHDGMYLHEESLGRAVYNPQYYSIDGEPM